MAGACAGRAGLAVAASGVRRDEHREARSVWASRALREYLDWPGAQQVLQIQPVSQRKGKRRPRSTTL